MALGALPDYPWDLMAPYRARAEAHEGGIVDVSIGSPVDPTPDVVREALARATDAHAYPLTVGTPELRAAIVEWFARRRGVTGLDAASVLPTIGSKELVALLPFMLGLGDGDVVVHPRAAYPTYEMGALFAGARAFASDDPGEWPAETRLVWLNSPGNPDGRVLDVDELRAARARAHELGAIIVSDECYAELGWDGAWADEPVPSLLDPRVTGGDTHHTLAIYSLSKQSNMAGYRAAFIAGCRESIARLTNVRKHAGLMPPAPLQEAMVVALGDDRHVAEQKERYRRGATCCAPRSRPPASASTAARAACTSGRPRDATRGTPSGGSPTSASSRVPGTSTGCTIPDHVRLSLTATDERIAAAAERLGASARA